MDLNEIDWGLEVEKLEDGLTRAVMEGQGFLYEWAGSGLELTLALHRRSQLS